MMVQTVVSKYLAWEFVFLQRHSFSISRTQLWQQELLFSRVYETQHEVGGSISAFSQSFSLIYLHSSELLSDF